MPVRLVFMIIAVPFLWAAAAQAQHAEKFEGFLTEVSNQYDWELSLYGLEDTETGLVFDLITLSSADGRGGVSFMGGAIAGISETEEGLLRIENLELVSAGLRLRDMPAAYNDLENREGVSYSAVGFKGPVELFKISGLTFFDLDSRLPPNSVERTPDTEIRAIFDGITLYLNNGIRLSDARISSLSLEITRMDEEMTQELGTLEIGQFKDGVLNDLTAKQWDTRGPTLPRLVRREGISIAKMAIQR